MQGKGKWLGAAALIAAVGCNESQIESGESEAPTQEFLLELPVEPVTTTKMTLGSWETMPTGAPLELPEQELELAIGEEYPESVELDLGFAVGACWGGGLTGVMELDDLSGRGDAVEFESSGPGRIGLRVVGEGRTTSTVTGVFTPSAEDRALPCYQNFAELSELEFTFELKVRAREVAGATLRSCVTADHVAMGLGARIDANPLPVDRDGVAFEPINAAAHRAVTIGIAGDVDSLEVSENSQDRLPAVEDVFLPARETTISLHPPVGEPIRIDVAGPDKITDVEVSFVVPNFPDQLVVEGGASYDREQLSRARDRIFPLATLPASVGQTPYCTPLSPEHFQLESSTAEVCEAEVREWIDYHDFKTLGVGAGFLGRSAHLKVDGECALTLRAPSFNGGAGWTASVEATFSDVDLLQSLDREER